MDSSPEQPDEITELLAAYALDALTPDERARVQRLLVEQPAFRQSLNELRASADLLPYGLDRPTLPPEWRQRTLDYALGRRSRTAVQPLSQQPTRRWQAWFMALSSIATVLFIAVLVLLSFVNHVRGELAIVTQQRDQAQSLAATAQASAQQVASVLANPAPLVTLSGESGQGAVFRDAAGNVVLIAALPSLADNQVYQLWLIEDGAAPVSGGVFTVDARGYGVLALPDESVRRGTTLAITAEPAPGSPVPTGAILIAGQAS